jgi:hypothetical protein
MKFTTQHLPISSSYTLTCPKTSLMKSVTSNFISTLIVKIPPFDLIIPMEISIVFNVDGTMAAILVPPVREDYEGILFSLSRT